jgi:hypothetical protein
MGEDRGPLPVQFLDEGHHNSARDGASSNDELGSGEKGKLWGQRQQSPPEGAEVYSHVDSSGSTGRNSGPLSTCSTVEVGGTTTPPTTGVQKRVTGAAPRRPKYSRFPVISHTTLRTGSIRTVATRNQQREL